MSSGNHKMTVRELISNYKRTHPKGHYFDKDTLQWFGERIGEMKIIGTDTCEDYDGNIVECYVLRSLQRNHPIAPTYKYTYFTKDKFNPISK